MKRIFAFIGLLCCGISYGQLPSHQLPSSLKGLVMDTTSHTFIPNVSVVVIRAKDSILLGFSTTDAGGAFLLTGLDTGRVIVLLSYPGYADYTDRIRIDKGSVDLGRISLTTRVAVLQEVVVRRTVSAVRLKGDTTEYLADSFRVQAGATVEDLLKQLPGVQVDRNGKITAQGEKVKKVLVDGEEFFGDDPTLVTQNLRADMVDKVQVYNKKSDQAAFTGIDDGVRDKTINLQLKENKKKGYFGKINFGAGTGGYYENQAMVNWFRGKEKFSAYSTVSNTGKVGLGWQDNNAYNGENDQSATKDVDLDAWDGNYNGQGIPTARTGGLHYNNKWNLDKVSLNANYKVADLDVRGSNDMLSQNNLPENIYYGSSDQSFRNRIVKHKVDMSSDIKMDSGSTLRIRVAGTLSHKMTSNQFSTRTISQDSSLLNSGNRLLSDDGRHNVFDGSILWEKRLGKSGRTISVSVAENYNTNNVTGILQSANSFFGKLGGLDSLSRTDQFKDNKGLVSLFDAKITYTQPLSHAATLIANYENLTGTSSSDIRSFNKSADSLYDDFDSLYSNHYRFNRETQKGGLGLSVNRGKWKLYAGNDVGFTSLTQNDVYKESSFSRHFVNWYPHLSLDYVISLQKQIGISYEGNTQQPLVDQVQPILTNYDPLNVYIGNQQLGPAYMNTLSIHYNSYQPQTQRYLFSNFNYVFSSNQITTDTHTDSSGRNTYQYVNVGGNSRYWGYIGFGGKIPEWNASLGINVSASGSRNVNFANGLRNISGNSMSSLEGYFGTGKKGRFELQLKANAAYNTNTSSLQQNASQNYWVFVLSPNADIFLPAKFRIHSDVNYTIRQKTPAFTTNLNVFLWDAWIGKSFLKKDVLLIKVVGNDLLDQNKGVSRTMSNNFISQNSYSTIRQYFLFSVNWNFSNNH